jgi:hypothetical protein
MSGWGLCSCNRLYSAVGPLRGQRDLWPIYRIRQIIEEHALQTIVIDVEKLMTCLRELADADFRRRAWLASDGPLISSFPELASHAFDDSGLIDSLQSDRCPRELDPESFSALRDLDTAVTRGDQDLAPTELIEDPRMAEVRQKARAALDILEQRYGDPLT